MKICDKLVTVENFFNVTRYDNGFVIEVAGRNNDEQYKTARILVNTVDELVDLVREAVTMKVDE